MNGIEWLATRIMNTANDAMLDRPQDEPRFNPRPPGVIRPDGATSVVLVFLQGHRGRYFTRGQIIAATERTERAVDWALLFLTSHKRIQAVGDGSRNPRYLRYGIKAELAPEDIEP